MYVLYLFYITLIIYLVTIINVKIGIVEKVHLKINNYLSILSNTLKDHTVDGIFKCINVYYVINITQ